ncbi:hypothetical protein [Rhodanobacter sp. C03]|uniref:hypothetical protein n=1 Tax=Rhodanobacter sp. C03 TaxID=1945858 RepID=UPI0009877132|nr:hypothetical protein [Rhodanobacter sp. C03]OOG54458.1 hypothetical protein B0E48_14285 [Rhodanobacter sp. C03]
MNNDLELSVTLNNDLPGHSFLVVNSGGHQHIFGKSEHPQAIVWTLAGNASNGEFCAPGDSVPGFAWPFDAPRSGIFSDLSKPASNKLRIVNHHTDRTTEGHWNYQLFARFGDHVYQTPWTTTNGSANTANPSIKNT